MNDLISQIFQDHVHMARILKLIESEIDALIAEEPRDLEVLDDSLRYLINYADKIHHAKEDIIFQRLATVDPDIKELIEDIFSEHQELFEKGREFQNLVQAAEVGDFVLRDEIVEKGKIYVSTLYSHMSKEEEHLLERARGTLSEEDFASLDLDNVSAADPVFGEDVQKEYRELYNHIVQQYGDDWQHPAHQLV